MAPHLRRHHRASKRGAIIYPDRVTTKEDDAFIRQLKRGITAIKVAAEGRRCGDCSNAVLDKGGRGHCAANVNYEGNSLSIYSHDAPACDAKYAPVSS